MNNYGDILYNTNADPCMAVDFISLDTGAASINMHQSCDFSYNIIDVGHFGNENINKDDYFFNSENKFNEIITETENNKNEKIISLENINNKFLESFKPVESSFNFQGNYQNYITKVIRSLPPLFKIDYDELVQQRLVLLPEYNKKKTLILDLDETLIHADFEEQYVNHDYRVNFDYKDEKVSVDIFVRPGVTEFLERMSHIYEIFLFTASKKEYADACLKVIDPNGTIFKHRLYRDSCIPINNKTYIKDLRIFVNRKQENLILVDNSFYSFSNQPKNGVLINSFYNNEDDKELLNLLNYLENYLHPSTDIRVVNEQIFNFSGLIDQSILSSNNKEKKN
jgi:Dullard-like phosphatase family protein